jgi:hypothetical protein
MNCIKHENDILSVHYQQVMEYVSYTTEFLLYSKRTDVFKQLRVSFPNAAYHSIGFLFLVQFFAETDS